MAHDFSTTTPLIYQPARRCLRRHQMDLMPPFGKAHGITDFWCNVARRAGPFSSARSGSVIAVAQIKSAGMSV